MTAAPKLRTAEDIVSIGLIIGLEVHVELATRSKMFSASPNPAHADHQDAPPNALTDPVVLALPGALPVVNERAVELAMLVGLALGCAIPPVSVWARKSYFYPDLPKGYQISQHEMPLCVGGRVDLPSINADGTIDPTTSGRTIRILRAHLEEDAGKLSHEGTGTGSLVDLNRAGTPLLEIVTEPDFRSADEVVVFARLLRMTCRHLGVTAGVMQRGHMRFEPNINLELRLKSGRRVRTPIVEIKNLNSFRAVRGAIEFERQEQPGRWIASGLEQSPGAKTTRGWDDARLRTTLQREKEDAHDYRYFPDPDLPPVEIARSWVERVRAGLCELPGARMTRYARTWGLASKDIMALIEERRDAELFDHAVDALVARGVDRADAGRPIAMVLLQKLTRLANEAGVALHELAITVEQIAGVVSMRHNDRIGSNASDELIELIVTAGDSALDPQTLATERGLLIVRDAGQLDAWCREVIAQNESIVAQIRAGKPQAIGRLIGAVMQRSGGSADARAVRERLIELIGDGSV